MTAARPKTDRSTRRLSEVAKKVVYPSTIVTTEWPRVVARCRDIGVEFDGWQHGIGSIALGKDANGKYAATVGGVVLSIPRQVGKTFLVGQMVIALCLLHPRLTVLWTAHRTRTATKTFQSMQGYVKRPKVAPHLMPSRNDGIRTANGEQEIEFSNGSKIMFGARADGFGRGFDEVDVEVFDEAQILPSRALDDMVAATMQTRQASGALLFFMGTPPAPLNDSDEWMNRRKKAYSGKYDKMVYVECGADSSDDLDDPKTWAKANPSFPDRTPVESMERLRENLTNEDSFRREGLGIYDDDHLKAAFARSDWIACQGDWRAGEMDVQGLALAVSFDMDAAAVMVAAVDGESVHVRPVHHEPGTGWVVDFLKAAQEREGLDVVVDAKSPAEALIPVLEREGVKLRIPKYDDVTAACSGIDMLVREHRLRHANYDELNRAVEHGERALKRDGRWTWRRKSGVDISLLEAATLAAWQASNPAKKTTSAYADRGVMSV